MGGPFESLGIDALIVAGIIFVVVSGMRFLAAYWLWQSSGTDSCCPSEHC
jgi:hypothetical protein